MNPGKRGDRPIRRNAERNAKRHRSVRVQPLPQDDPGDGFVVAVDYALSYGFVDSVTVYDEPVKVNRTRRRDYPVAFPPAQRVHVVFDCVSAQWFDLNVPFNGQYAWDSAAIAANSFHAEFDIPLGWYQSLNQRTSPVSGLPMPAVEEGTWWTLRFDPFAQYTLPTLLTLPVSANPVSTILSSIRRVDDLADLVVPRNFLRLRRFSHGWGLVPNPSLPPYPGR